MPTWEKSIVLGIQQTFNDLMSKRLYKLNIIFLTWIVQYIIRNFFLLKKWSSPGDIWKKRCQKYWLKCYWVPIANIVTGTVRHSWKIDISAFKGLILLLCGLSIYINEAQLKDEGIVFLV